MPGTTLAYFSLLPTSHCDSLVSSSYASLSDDSEENIILYHLLSRTILSSRVSPLGGKGLGLILKEVSE
jgi:hypothetical protein